MQVVDWSHVCIDPQKKFLSSAFFLLAKLPQKEKLEFTNSKKKSDFGGFQSSKVTKKLAKIIRFFYLVFSM